MHIPIPAMNIHMEDAGRALVVTVLEMRVGEEVIVRATRIHMCISHGLSIYIIRSRPE